MVQVSARRHHAERRAGRGTPTSGQFSRWGPAQPAAGGRREGPPVPRWSLLGRDLGVQRHPDRCVVHAFRCAARSGAGRRSAFPALRVVQERSDTPLLRCAQRADRRSAFPALRVVKARSDPSLLRCAQRADRRSAFQAVPALFRSQLPAFRKNNGSEPPVRCPPDRGASVKVGAPPLSQNSYSRSELAAVRRRRTREFRWPAPSAGRPLRARSAWVPGGGIEPPTQGFSVLCSTV